MEAPMRLLVLDVAMRKTKLVVALRRRTAF